MQMWLMWRDCSSACSCITVWCTWLTWWISTTMMYETHCPDFESTQVGLLVHHCKDFHFPFFHQFPRFSAPMTFPVLHLISSSLHTRHYTSKCFICFTVPHLCSYSATFTLLACLHHFHLFPVDLHASFLHCFSHCIQVFLMSSSSLVINSTSLANRVICTLLLVICTLFVALVLF